MTKILIGSFLIALAMATLPACTDDTAEFSIDPQPAPLNFATQDFGVDPALSNNDLNSLNTSTTGSETASPNSSPSTGDTSGIDSDGGSSNAGNNSGQPVGDTQIALSELLLEKGGQRQSIFGVHNAAIPVNDYRLDGSRQVYKHIRVQAGTRTCEHVFRMSDTDPGVIAEPWRAQVLAPGVFSSYLPKQPSTFNAFDFMDILNAQDGARFQVNLDESLRIFAVHHCQNFSTNLLDLLDLDAEEIFNRIND